MRTQKINFSTKEKAERFMENYGDEIFSKRGYAPVRAYFNEGSQAWQVTSSYINATDIYLNELKERGVLRMPHNCTKLQMGKLVLKQLLFDIDTLVIDIIANVRDGYQTSERMDRLNFLMSIARKMEGEDSHKNRIVKFMIFLKDNSFETGRIAAFEEYFTRKIQHFNTASCKDYDEQKMNAKRAYSRFFCLVENIKKELECGKNVGGLLGRAEILWNEFKDLPILSYKKKQAENELIFCKQAC
ncbi:MAG: hypothetical protein IKP37_03395 [Paludibacteraceae bacterium]|nr:hypothetical protein [Paludibacteraceae bacterium]